MERIISEKLLEQYRGYLYEEEKGSETIGKYMRDLRKLLDYMGGKELDKARMISYKNFLIEQNYKISSINSFLVAANRFFEHNGWHDLRVKTFKIQQEAFCPEKRCLTKEEYKKLVNAALRSGRRRLSRILQTICATGIRVSELRFVTVESVKKGVMEIRCKGKIRQVLIPRQLQRLLFLYLRERGIERGSVFCTDSGKPVDRSNIWREMKAICKETNVDREKVFPHNLRHLFAQEFYEIKKDIAKLADVLGHSSIETTRIYIKTSGREHQRQLEMMGLVLEI